MTSEQIPAQITIYVSFSHDGTIPKHFSQFTSSYGQRASFGIKSNNGKTRTATATACSSFSIGRIDQIRVIVDEFMFRFDHFNTSSIVVRGSMCHPSKTCSC